MSASPSTRRDDPPARPSDRTQDAELAVSLDEREQHRVHHDDRPDRDRHDGRGAVGGGDELVVAVGPTELDEVADRGEHRARVGDALLDRRDIGLRVRIDFDEQQREPAGLPLERLERHEGEHRRGVPEDVAGRVDADDLLRPARDVDRLPDARVQVGGEPRAEHHLVRGVGGERLARRRCARRTASGPRGRIPISMRSGWSLSSFSVSSSTPTALRTPARWPRARAGHPSGSSAGCPRRSSARR